MICSTKFLPVLFAICFFLSGCRPTVLSRGLNENFKDNRNGWVEERTDYHYLMVHDGRYMIQSRDTSYARTSANSFVDDYLAGLPEEYAIGASMFFTEVKTERASAGIILKSPSIEYTFSVYTDGWVLFSEYLYHTDSTVTLLSKFLEYDASKVMDLRMDFNRMDVSLKVNNQEVGKARLKCETEHWRDLRLYTSSGSTVMFEKLHVNHEPLQ